MKIVNRLRAVFADPAVYHALILFVALRVFLSVWAIVALTLHPLPTQPDEGLRPYLGETPLTEGIASLLLGPWQRFDTLHYLRIARQGYASLDDSVFPPLYPLAIRGLGMLLTYALPPSISYLLAGLILSNLACLGSLILLHRVTTAEVGAASATKTLIYLALFPTGFFLFAAYTEPIFLLFALGSMWAARRGRAWQAGLLGVLAGLTRLTGWVLIVPFVYEYLRQRDFNLRRLDWGALAALLPPLGLVGFLGWRWWARLPTLDEVYRQHWHRTPGFVGADVLTAIRIMLSGQGSFTLFFDFFCTVLLLATIIVVFRRLGPTHGLYSAMMLLFIVLPNSNIIPLYSASRFTLTFFPNFMVLGLVGRSPWINRLILYPSLILYLYFSGQYFIWGWVA
jgi:hypothetical protein